ncbi:MAG: hypothetical protein JXB10_08645 [Pirellulales bacterium]|nr:hypothetical protein [Pirellulales bacterium]
MISPTLLPILFTLPLLGAGELVPPEKPVLAPSAAAAADPFLADAQLNAVFFLDARRGWAVGDRGAIWHTDDGGRLWTVQTSGVRGTLSSVSFVDEKTGFTAGGTARPFAHDGVGVFLSTTDGGRTWSCPTRQELPPLRRIRFLDAEIGWAVATPSALFPAGVLITRDGGRTWKPIGGGAPTAWLTGEMVDPLTGALAGRDGIAARVLRGCVKPLRNETFGLRNLRAMTLLPPVHGWLVGDGGLVMTTVDLGAAWQTPVAEVPPQIAAQFDFAALAVRGEKVWIAGTPGTRVVYSPDAGRSWSVFPTGNRLPLEALTFADDQRGWAVGALGTILATEDGGRTWVRQRCGGTRAALLTLVAEADAVPLELLARLSGQDGYLAAVEALNRRGGQTPDPTTVPLPDRLQQAIVAVGGSRADLAWQFPIRQQGVSQTPQDFLGDWDRTHDGRGRQIIEAHLVRQIRLWRPEIIVTGGDGSLSRRERARVRAVGDEDQSPHPNPLPKGEGTLEDLIAQLVLSAAEKASDATSYPQQITEAGLEPWQVKRIFTPAEPGGQDAVVVAADQALSRLGGAVSDVAAEPRGLLQDAVSAGPPTLTYRKVWDRSGGTSGRGDFFTGIVLPPGGEARRELFDPPDEDLAARQRAAVKRRHVLAIFRQAEGDRSMQQRLLGQTAQLLDGLDDAGAAQLLADLAGRCARSGRGSMAAELYARLARSYPQHSLARLALLWLVQYYSSGEAAWCRSSKGDSPPLGEQGTAPLVGPDRAAELGKEIEGTRPELFAAPALRFALAAAHRQQGYPGQAERFYLTESRSPRSDAWTLCAQGEQWLADPRNEPPKPTMPCFAARTKPRLDGRLDDEVWKKIRTAPLESADADDAAWPACAALAYDREYLYVAVHCRKAPGANYPPPAGPRPRDADLRGSDHFEILLDMDRDYATYYRLTIDSRGWTAEDCWGDATWNPGWFVAADNDDETWTVEAAVPWKALTGRVPQPRDAWCVGLQRTVPGVGFQSWSAPASTKVAPEGFGYLLFE